MMVHRGAVFGMQLGHGSRTLMSEWDQGSYKKGHKDFPGGLVNRSLPANAGDTDSVPGLGGFHIPWSNQAWVLQLMNLLSQEPETREATTMQSSKTTAREQPPLSATGESPQTAMKTQHNQK